MKDGQQLPTPNPSQDVDDGTVNRPSSQPLRDATPNTQTPGDNLPDPGTPATSIEDPATSSPLKGSPERLGRTPVEEEDFRIFASPKPAARTGSEDRDSTATSQLSRQRSLSRANNMNLTGHHRNIMTTSPVPSILVPETEVDEDMLPDSEISETGSEENANPYKKIAHRARDRSKRLTETIESSTWLLRRFTRRHEFDVAELARAKASGAQFKQERDAAIAEADGKIAAAAAEKNLVVAKQDGRDTILGLLLVLLVLAVLVYIYWCQYNSADFRYIREVGDKFYNVKNS